MIIDRPFRGLPVLSSTAGDVFPDTKVHLWMIWELSLSIKYTINDEGNPVKNADRASAHALIYSSIQSFVDGLPQMKVV